MITDKDDPSASPFPKGKNVRLKSFSKLLKLKAQRERSLRKGDTRRWGASGPLPLLSALEQPPSSVRKSKVRRSPRIRIKLT